MSKPNRLRIHFASGRTFTSQPTTEGNAEAKIKEIASSPDGFNVRWSKGDDEHLINGNLIERLEILPPVDEKAERNERIMYIARRVTSNLVAAAWLAYILAFPVENILIKSVYVLMFAFSIHPTSRD